MTDEALHSPIKNVLNAIHLGKLTYALIAIGQLIKLPLRRQHFTLDGSKTLRFKRFYFAASHNLPYEGGGFKFAPDARPDDGILHICAVHGLSKLIVPALLPTAFWGGHLKFSGVESFSCQKMHITLDNPYPVHTDGETYRPHRELDVWCEAGKLHLSADKRTGYDRIFGYYFHKASKACIDGKQELFTEAYTIYYISEGSIELPSENCKYRLFPGDCLFIPPYTRTYINAFAPARVLKVSFSAAIFIRSLFKIPGIHFPWLIPPKSICKEIEPILASMVRGAAINPENSRFSIFPAYVYCRDYKP